MKLEEQVVSLELAKKLKELGVNQESIWFWWENTDKIGEAYLQVDERNLQGPQHAELITDYAKIPCCYSAFTVAELGEMLPNGCHTFKTDLRWVCRHWWPELGGALRDKGGTNYKMEGANTEADARAKMLIYLIENKLLTP